MASDEFAASDRLPSKITKQIRGLEDGGEFGNGQKGIVVACAFTVYACLDAKARSSFDMSTITT